MTSIQSERLMELFSSVGNIKPPEKYLHWDKLQHYPAPAGVNHEEWWLAIKLARAHALRPIGLTDKTGEAFRFAIPECIHEELHQIDLGAGGQISVPAPIVNPQTRDQYLISSLMEEAITSSQLEGAVTTREVAKEMIRTGRQARDVSEQMILNNYATMQRIRELKDQPLSRDLVLQIHRLVTEKTLDDPTAAGRFRRSDERRVVSDDYGQIYHEPPPAEQLEQRMEAMCALANGKFPDYFIHPAIRSIILHFWLAYDHPFVDGNGRTARALFYWAMLRHGYWLFEFISISSILRKAPSKYGLSFLLTETDDNDLTYFLVAQTEVIRRSIRELHAYIERKRNETHEAEVRMRALDLFNHRQVELLRHALKHPGQRYSFRSHQTSHNVAYQTARTDLLELEAKGLLDLRMKGKQRLFVSPNDLSERLMKVDREFRGQ